MRIYKKEYLKLIQIFYTLTTGICDAQLTLFFNLCAIPDISMHEQQPKAASSFSGQSACKEGWVLNMHNVHSIRLLCVVETVCVYYPNVMKLLGDVVLVRSIKNLKTAILP